jgi:hypothetical protein
METVALFNVSYAWAVGCTVLHAVAAAVLRPAVIPRLAMLSKVDKFALPNTFVAATHASILFVAAVRHLAPRMSFADEGLLLFPVHAATPMHPAESFWCCAMIGYLIYDTLFSLVTGTDGFDMAAHHVLGLASWGSLRLANYGGLWLMWVHLAEVRHTRDWYSVACTPSEQTNLPRKPNTAGLDAVASFLYGVVQAEARRHRRV